MVPGVPDADEAVCWKSLSGEACTKARTARDSIRTDKTHGSLSAGPPKANLQQEVLGHVDCAWLQAPEGHHQVIPASQFVVILESKCEMSL